MQNAYIVADNVCEVNIDVNQETDIKVASITGVFRINVLKKGDYFKYIQDGKEQTYTMSEDINTSLLTDSIIVLFGTYLSYEPTTNQYKYKVDITECSTRFKYVFGITKLPVKANQVTQTMPFGNGPTFLTVVCDKLKGSGVITPNVYAVDSIFNLEGPGFSGNDLRNLTFRIVGLYGEDVEIADDLLWTFQIGDTPENYNKFNRFWNKYR